MKTDFVEPGIMKDVGSTLVHDARARDGGGEPPALAKDPRSMSELPHSGAQPPKLWNGSLRKREESTRGKEGNKERGRWETSV